MARTKNIIDRRNYYDIEETVERLSANAGREISKDYPRLLARKGKIESVVFGTRDRLYSKESVDAYVVSDKRGRKPNQKREQVLA